MLYEAESYEHAGIPVRIVYDPEPQDPREWTQLGEMVCWHRRYNLGDRQIDSREQEALERGGMRLLNRYLRLVKGATCVVPLGLIDHSGLAMYPGGGPHWSDSAGWDSGTVGFIYDTPEGRADCGTPPDKIEEGLKAEIKEYDQFLRGEVYGYIVADGCDDEESCFGFFGDLEYVVSEANEMAENIAHERAINTEPRDVAEVLALTAQVA